ncbi:MAG: substrate-binding domain-containing protein [Oscillospiraceae bacterium]|nr:substrate-binding domain-containing protein [Oscillospiraceae bacterium]
MENRHIFAVITARPFACEQIQLLDGIISQGLKMNTDIVIISNIYNASEYNDFIKLENNIYSLISSEKPEGFLITGDAFMNKSLLEQIFSYLDEHDIPVVCSGSTITRYPSIDSCTESDFEQITDHLINIHHFSEIDILTGPDNLATSHDRVRGFQRSLQKHGLHNDDNNIIYGDFWLSGGENTALAYIRGERRMPQAVICANDYMAFAMCDTFVAHGVRIPEDITVVGYEYVEGRTNHYPILTTYERNRKALGIRLFDMLYERVTGKCDKTDISLEGKIIRGDTCECGADYKYISSETAEIHRQQLFLQYNATGMLEQYLTNTKTISDLIRELRTHSYFLPDLSGLFLCLNEDWCISPKIMNSDSSCDMICYSIQDKFTEDQGPVHFSKTDLLPGFLRISQKPNAYFCLPLFFMDRDFGYMTVRYDKSANPGDSLRNWLKIVSNALEFLRMKNDIDYLMQCRNLSELHDSVTGLYNRTGFINELDISVRNAGNESDITMLLMRLNSENTVFDDNYIFEKTSFLTDTAEIFRSFAISPGKICGRIDENIFAAAVIGHDSSSEYEDRLADRIEALMYRCFVKYGIYGPEFCTISTFSGKIAGSESSQILNDLQTRSESETSVPDGRSSDPQYIRYCKFRNRNYIKPSGILQANEACREFCLSSGHFRAVYRQFFNTSYHHDSIIMRVRLSKYLLLSSGMSIASIAEKCGYNNEKYFMQQFRLITGMTPNMYRKIKI